MAGAEAAFAADAAGRGAGGGGAVAELDEQRARRPARWSGPARTRRRPGRRRASLAEEIEWYLLARLAAQRSVSLGRIRCRCSSTTPSRGLDEDELGHVLGRLERMAEAVQVIVITDDPLAAPGRSLAGEDRAARGPPAARLTSHRPAARREATA